MRAVRCAALCAENAVLCCAALCPQVRRLMELKTAEIERMNDMNRMREEVVSCSIL